MIDLAREHKENEGANPTAGVDVPESPASAPERAKQEEPVEIKQEAAEVFDGTVSDAVGDLLSNVEQDSDWRPLELPSRGKAYIESDGVVNIKPFT